MDEPNGIISVDIAADDAGLATAIAGKATLALQVTIVVKNDSSVITDVFTFPLMVQNVVDPAA